MAIKWRVKAPDAFVEKLVRGLHDAGDEIFDGSQVAVPVDKGTLKETGVLEKHSRGFRILYRTTYAARQEFGLPPGHTENVKRHTVQRYTTRAHRRKTATGKVGSIPAVEHPGHSRGPYTRVFKEGLKGRKYLTGAWEEVRPRLVQFITRLYRRNT